MSTTKTMTLSKIKETVFVRVALNEERVAFFMALYKSGQKVPLIKVTADGQLEEGRHRKEAMLRLGLKQAEIEVTEKKSHRDLIIAALAANVGGALPPSDADVNFSIRQLIRAGMPPDKIVAKVSQATKFVAKYVRRLVKDAQSSINKENLSKAIAAVGEGNLTARQAAKKFEVTFSSLKFLLGGKKKALDVQGLDEIKAGLTSRFRSLSGSNAKLIAPLLEGFGDGGVEEKVVRGTIDHFDHLIDNLARAAVNWRKRFDVAMKQKKKASA